MFLRLKPFALKAGADANALDADSSKPIHAAAFSGHAAIVELLFPVTSPREGEKWTVDSLMAETSSAGSAVSSEQAPSVLLLLCKMQDVNCNVCLMLYHVHCCMN